MRRLEYIRRRRFDSLRGRARIDRPFEITIADYPPLKAQIVRTHQDNHGIAFDGDAKEIANLVDEILLETPHQRDKRSFPRRLVLLSSSFYLGDEFVKCKVQNISAGGFFAKVDKCPEAGTTIEFNLARFGTMPVRVIWANEKGMGGVFLENLGADHSAHRIPASRRPGRQVHALISSRFGNRCFSRQAFLLIRDIRPRSIAIEPAPAAPCAHRSHCAEN